MYRPLIARPPAVRPSMPFESLERRVHLSAALAYPVTDLPYSTGDPVATTSVGGAAFLGVAGGTLYRSYGTAADTVQFNSGIRALHDWDGVLYTAYYPFLYRADANSTGDQSEIKDAEGNYHLERATHFVDVGDKLYFNADSEDIRRHGMFVLDRGSTAARYVGPGTPMGAAGGRLLYSTYDETPGSNRWTLWATDGTTVENLADGFANNQAFILNNSTLLIDGPGGLWKSDGTPGGTALIKPDAGGVREWLRVGDSVYYLNAVTARPSGLWKTDGTPQGTVLVHAAVAVGGATPDIHPTLTNVGDTVYFVSYPDAGGPRQLFATRGPGTTRQVTSIGSDPLMDGVFLTLTAVGDDVFFGARPDSTGYKLWQTDGTRVSEVQLAGPPPAADAGPPAQLITSGGSLYFTQEEPNGPNRLWRYGVIPAVVDPDGTLVVYGTDPAEGVAGNDAITLSASADTVSAVLNGETFSFPAASVRRITVNALSGDDVLTVGDTVRVPLAYNASDGAETFAVDGTAGDDVIAVEADGVRVGDRQYHFSNLDRLTVRGLGGNDSITVDGTPAAEVTVDGGDGDERVVVRPTSPSQQPPSGNLTVFGGGGANSLVLDDSARSSAQQYDLSEFSLVRPADYPGGPVPRPLLFADFAAGVSLVGGEGSDLFRVTPGGKAPLSVDGGPPTAGGQAPGDAIAIVPAGANGARLEPSPGGAGRYTFDNRQPVTFSGIEIPDNLRDPSATAGRLVDAFGTTHVGVTFDEPVLMPEAPGSALRLTNLSTGQTIDPATVGATSVSTTTELVFRFVNAGRPFTLPSGRYEATVPAGSVSDFAGHATAADFTFTFSVPPRIVGAWATGTTWAPAFRERLPIRTGAEPPSAGVSTATPKPGSCRGRA